MKDTKTKKLLAAEQTRQKETLMLIPSENFASADVRKAVGSVLMNKYSEGYPGKRYYQGNEFIDEIENLAIERAKKLFDVPHVNVQPYSGSPANAAIYMGLLKENAKIMGLKLKAGGHLTHGHPKITFSGKYFTPVQFNVEEDGTIDHEKVKKLAKKEKPDLIVVGTTAYPRKLQWKKWRDIADAANAILVADISHIAGLVVGGAHASPTRYADVVMTTTHKTLRGPRGAMIMVTKRGLRKDKDMADKIDQAVFPGLQGGPHNNTTAGIAVALDEAGKAKFKTYTKQIVRNAKAMASELKKHEIDLVTDGTDNHLMVIDLRKHKLVGNFVAEALEVANIITNRNSVPHDPNKPFYPSGLRIGTPALTTQGMKTKEMKQIAQWIARVIENVSEFNLPNDKNKRGVYMKHFRKDINRNKLLKDIKKEVTALAKKFPPPVK